MGRGRGESAIPVSLFDAYVSLGEGECDLLVRALLTLSGSLDPDCLREALHRVLELEPVLLSRFERRATWPVWREDRSAEAEVFAQIQIPDVSERVPDIFVQREDPFAAPQLRVLLVRSEGKNRILLTASHVSVDAGGLREIAYALASTYTALEAGAGRGRPVPETGCLRPERLLEGLSRPGLLSSARRALGPRPTWGLPARGRAPEESGFVLERMALEEVLAARQFARARDVSMTEVLATALHRSLSLALDPAEGPLLPIRIPVDLRRYVPGGVPCFRNLFGGFEPAIARGRGEPFEATLRRLAAVASPLLVDRPGLEMVPALRLLFSAGYGPARCLVRRAIDRYVGKGVSRMVFSNLSILSPERLRFGDGEAEEAFLLGPVARPPSFCLVVSTFRGEMTLAAGTSGAADDRLVATSILKRMVAELACGARIV